MRIFNYTGVLCTAVVAVFLAFFAGSVSSYLLVVPPLPVLGDKPPQTDEALAREQLAASVAERNIFGVDKTVPPAPGIGGSAAEGGVSSYEAPFDGKLTGILAGTDGKDIRAIVLKNNKDVLVLRRGETLEGYSLKNIEGETAVVTVNGVDYILELQDGLKDGAAAASPQSPPARSAQPYRPPQNNTAAQVTEGTENITLERSELTGQLKDINKVISTLLASPTYEDKELVGYRIVRMQNESPVRQLGILPGDIINRINGETLTNPQIFFNMLQQVADISAISVDITRNGIKKTLFVEIQ
jgi:general secretion pathway protein C